jgi:hypothetical protein
MANQAIALQARAPRIPTYNELVAGRDQARSRQNTMAMQEQGMQQAANAQAEAAQQKAAMRNALMMAGSGDIAGAEKQYGLGAGNLEVQTALTGLKKDRAGQERAKLEAAGVAAYAALRVSDPAQRKALFQQATPMLQAAGWTPEQIAQFPVDDESLDGAVLNGLKPEEALKSYTKSQEGYTLTPGSKRFVGDKEVASVAPTEGITYVQTPEGLIPLPKTVSGGGSGLVGGARGSAGGADTVYGNGKFAQPPKPLTQSSIGEVQDFQRTSLIPATRGKVGAGPRKGTGAVGTYQITYGTLKDYAPKVLGDIWRNTPFTADVQERIAKAIYEDVKGGNLKDTWAGLPANKPGAYANVPWEQVRGKIAQVESGGGVKMGQVIPGTAKPADSAAAAKTTEDERKIASNVRNMISASKEMASVVREDPSAIAPSGGEYAAGQVPFYGDEASRFAQSGPRQRFNAALEKVLSAVTFINTGAGVSKEQMDGYRRSYFPTYQDTERTRQSKLLGVVQFIRDAKARAGNAWTPELDSALSELQKMFGSKATYKAKGAAPAAAPASSSGWGKAEVVGD